MCTRQQVFQVAVITENAHRLENAQNVAFLLGILPMAMKIQGENQAPSSSKHSTISLDPGVRTFMTGYDADASLCEWGKGDMGRIFRLCYTHDKLHAMESQERSASPALPEENCSTAYSS
jgi:hypothetical protein